MPYFISDKNLGLNQTTEFFGDDVRHVLLAHRSKVGDKIKVQGPDGKRYLVEIVEIDRNKLKFKSLEEIPVPQEPKVKITLYQSVVSEKALDFIFQKGTELGLNKIVLFNSAKTATKLSSEAFKKKQERWNKILVESAKQCERARWPSLEFLSGIDEVILTAKDLDSVFLCDIDGEKLSANPKISSAGIIVGPEGGFAVEETVRFKSLPNIQPISLGPILLRAETAALASISIISNIFNK